MLSSSYKDRAASICWPLRRADLSMHAGEAIGPLSSSYEGRADLAETAAICCADRCADAGSVSAADCFGKLTSALYAGEAIGPLSSSYEARADLAEAASICRPLFQGPGFFITYLVRPGRARLPVLWAGDLNALDVAIGHSSCGSYASRGLCLAAGWTLLW